MTGVQTCALPISNDNNLWQFDIAYNFSGGATNNLAAHPGQNLSNIDSTTNTSVLTGQFPNNSGSLTMSPVGVFTQTASFSGSSTTITLSAANVRIGAGQIVTGTGIASGTTVVSVVTTTVTLSQATLSTQSGVTLTFDNQISVSGGCVVLHPYLFVYGNNGLIQNSSAGDWNNWVSADSNANNVATGKIVKGLPLRGGTTSPAGLFWSLDAVIRVTFSPSSVSTSTGGTQTYYWRYD